MKYNTIEIRPETISGGGWRISHYEDKQDRVKTKTSPHSLGFFHYPKNKSRKWAFETLKKHLIDIRKKEIETLTADVSSLESLEDNPDKL